MGVIYALAHPETMLVRYVGKTTGTLQSRLNEHMHVARGGIRRQRKLACWMRSLFPSKPAIIALEVDPVDLDDAERRWISDLRSRGFDLCNMTDGGDGQKRGYIPSAETIAKLKSYRHSEATKLKIRLSNLGRKRSAESRARMSAASMGKPGTMTGRKLSPDSRAKLSAGLKLAYVSGRRSRFQAHTLETRLRMSAAQRLAYATGVQPSRRGRKNSPQAIQHMVLAQTKRRIADARAQAR